MNRWTTALVVLMAVGGIEPASGAIIFSDNFNNENGGIWCLNYTGFKNWTVTAGSVDLIGVGSQWNWFPDHGLYVDMDGSTNNAGTMLSIASFLLTPGTYRLSYDLAGSQRYGYSPTDEVIASVETGVSSAVYTLTPGVPFATYYQDFTLATSQSVTIQFLETGLLGSGDNVGLLLDNVELESIPEPSTLIIWSLLGGLGITIGRCCRRKAA